MINMKRAECTPFCQPAVLCRCVHCDWWYIHVVLIVSLVFGEGGSEDRVLVCMHVIHMICCSVTQFVPKKKKKKEHAVRIEGTTPTAVLQRLASLGFLATDDARREKVRTMGKKCCMYVETERSAEKVRIPWGRIA